MYFIISFANQTVFPATPGAEPSSIKKACDRCRERRVRCNPHSSGSCESCLALGKACTFKYVYKKRGRKKVAPSPEYVKSGYTLNSLQVQSQRHSSASSVAMPTPPFNLSPQFSDPTMPHFNDLGKYSLTLNQFL